MNYNLILPMEKHTEISDNRYNSSKWKLKDGPIIIPPYELMSLGQNAEHSIGRDGCFSRALRISKPAFFVETGENVEKYFRFHSVVSIYGRKTLQETAEFLKNRQDNEQWMDLSYVEALDLLGLPAPEDFRRKYDREMRERKMNVLENLKKLTEKEAGLRGRINNIFASVKVGTYSPDGVGITVCENEDDARAISIGQRMDLEKVRGEIKNYLMRAMELEMHKTDMRIDLQPGVTMNVPQYVLGMWERYVGKQLPKEQRN